MQRPGNAGSLRSCTCPVGASLFQTLECGLWTVCAPGGRSCRAAPAPGYFSMTIKPFVGWCIAMALFWGPMLTWLALGHPKWAKPFVGIYYLIFILLVIFAACTS